MTESPLPATTDEKDWTWTLERQCPECGLEASRVQVAQVGDLVRESTPRWRAALARDDASVRPAPRVWSTTEYGAHVRDVNRLFDQRLTAMLAQDTPTFADWDQNAAALEGDYAGQDPAVVADELAAAAEAIAARFDSVTADQYQRRGLRSDGSQFTVETLAQYYWHEVVHHLYDVGA